LANAPLERVIARVRFPVILKIEDKSAVSNFQEIIRHHPVLRESQNQSMLIQMGPNAPSPFRASTGFGSSVTPRALGKCR
jgi:uncharacterized protein (TIGR04255 family)